jgi:hypothetical protein
VFKPFVFSKQTQMARLLAGLALVAMMVFTNCGKLV